MSRRPALWRDRTGAVAVEFALVAPTFLMFVFLILDGGRLMFAKQSLNELASATARCAGIKASGCADAGSAQAWAINRGLVHDNLKLAATDVVVTIPANCNGQPNMAQATVKMTWKRGAMNLLPQSMVSSQLQSIACFPSV